MILCTDAMLEDRLMRPFALDIRDHGGYFIVRAKGSKESAPARAFREWLQAEMAETQRKFASIKSASAKK